MIERGKKAGPGPGGDNRWRRGTATVEMAVISPLLLAMILGMIEFGYVFMIQQSLTNSVREATRVAALPGSTEEDVRQRLISALQPTGLNIRPDMVVIEPATQQNPVVTVSLQVPYDEVSLLRVLPSQVLAGFLNQGGSGGCTMGEKKLGARCSMRKEGSI